ncbi:flavin reductase [Micrococcaceae sp. AOP34-BR2-30]
MSTFTTQHIDAQHFRWTMGRYPTGVALISAIEADGNPVGMIVGTFSSVSLDPPLVSFMPTKVSTSWPRIQKTGRFAVSILSAEQESVVRAFSGKTATKFDTVEWSPSAGGSPLIDGAIAWIDCVIADVVDAGDHVIVLGSVLDLQPVGDNLPLLFFQGGFGGFTPHSLAATSSDLGIQLAVVDRIRPAMEDIARIFNCGCVVGGKESEDFVILASAGSDATPWLPDMIGKRVRAAAPFGRTAMAFADEGERTRWIEAGASSHEELFLDRDLRAIQQRGYSLSSGNTETAGQSGDVLTSMDPGPEVGTDKTAQRINSVAFPLRVPELPVPMILSTYGLDLQADSPQLTDLIRDLAEICRRIETNFADQEVRTR